MPDKSGVYLLEFKTGVYVGSSKHVRRRILRHLADLQGRRHSNGFMQRVYDRHGIPSFKILLECSEIELLQREQEFIDLLRPRLNLSPTAGRNIGHTHTPETLERMSEAGKVAWAKRPRSVGADQRRKISEALAGRSFSEETRSKISEAKRGVKRSPEQRAMMSAAKKGRKINQPGHAMTPEILAKIATTKAARLIEGRKPAAWREAEAA